MRRKLPIFYNALLLTGVNLLLRMAGTSFQVFISGRIGAAGVGLLQLVTSVGSLALVAGMAGVRTAAMYLTAEELGKKRPGNVRWVLSGCFLYSLLCSGTVGMGLYVLAPRLAAGWIGDPGTTAALQLLGAFLPIVCLCGVMSGYFTAENRIGALAIVEIGEQLCAMGVTLLGLLTWAGTNSSSACCAVILGNCAGSCVTLVSLVLLHLWEDIPTEPPIPVRLRLTQAAVPLALADIVKSGISTTEHLMVPKRLALHPASGNPLAAFGVVSGMVFPVMMFPACILFGLAELLIPEMARCAAAGSKKRISYLVRRSLKVAMLYGITFGGLLYLTGDELCMRLYRNPEAGRFLRLYALLVPMLYCDAITDAMTKGLGKQKICVRYNIMTNGLDVLFLFFLLPKYGMMGYFVSFLLTHLLNFILSIRLLLRITGVKIPFCLPAFSLSAVLIGVWACGFAGNVWLRAAAFLPLLGSLLFLLGVVRREDLRWVKGLLRGHRSLTSVS